MARTVLMPSTKALMSKFGARALQMLNAEPYSPGKKRVVEVVAAFEGERWVDPANPGAELDGAPPRAVLLVVMSARFQGPPTKTGFLVPVTRPMSLLCGGAGPNNNGDTLICWRWFAGWINTSGVGPSLGTLYFAKKTAPPEAVNEEETENPTGLVLRYSPIVPPSLVAAALSMPHMRVSSIYASEPDKHTVPAFGFFYYRLVSAKDDNAVPPVKNIHEYVLYFGDGSYTLKRITSNALVCTLPGELASAVRIGESYVGINYKGGAYRSSMTPLGVLDFTAGVAFDTDNPLFKNTNAALVHNDYVVAFCGTYKESEQIDISWRSTMPNHVIWAYNAADKVLYPTAELPVSQTDTPGMLWTRLQAGTNHITSESGWVIETTGAPVNNYRPRSAILHYSVTNGIAKQIWDITGARCFVDDKPVTPVFVETTVWSDYAGQLLGTTYKVTTCTAGPLRRYVHRAQYGVGNTNASMWSWYPYHHAYINGQYCQIDLSPNWRAPHVSATDAFINCMSPTKETYLNFVAPYAPSARYTNPNPQTLLSYSNVLYSDTTLMCVSKGTLCMPMLAYYRVGIYVTGGRQYALAFIKPGEQITHSPCFSDGVLFDLPYEMDVNDGEAPAADGYAPAVSTSNWRVFACGDEFYLVVLLNVTGTNSINNVTPTLAVYNARTMQQIAVKSGPKTLYYFDVHVDEKNNRAVLYSASEGTSTGEPWFMGLVGLGLGAEKEKGVPVTHEDRAGNPTWPRHLGIFDNAHYLCGPYYKT